MSKVAVVTDSSACLPADMLRAHEIRAVPLTFLFDGEVYEDGSLSSEEFYSLLRAARKFPTTSAPAPEAFLEAFREASQQAESCLCVVLPSAFSGAHSSAVSATEIARQEMPDFPVRVVDSHCLAMCHGFAALSAARAAQRDADLDQVERAVRHVASHSYLIGALDTMRYLVKSGRVPVVLHWASSLLRIKPILVAEGEDVRAAARVRTMSRALDRLVSNIGERLDGQRPLHMAVMHADAPEIAHRLAQTIRERFEPDELLETEFTSVMGAHTGPGFAGVAFFSGDPLSSAISPAGGSHKTLDDDVNEMEAALGDLPPAGSTPALVLVTGLPGSGKTYFSRQLCGRYPLVHLNSDVLRRVLFRRPNHSQAESQALFAAIHALMDRLLSRGVSVALDATSLKETYRRPVYEIAERNGARLIVVQTQAPPAVARRRLEVRARATDPLDPSDATVPVYDRMRKEAEPIQRAHIVVNTSREIGPALEQVIQHLAVTNSV